MPFGVDTVFGLNYLAPDLPVPNPRLTMSEEYILLAPDERESLWALQEKKKESPVSRQETERGVMGH